MIYNSYYYIVFSIFAIILVMMILDQNVSAYIDLQFKKIILDIKRIYWMIRLHPDNPIARWNLERRAKRQAEQLMKEYGIEED